VSASSQSLNRMMCWRCDGCSWVCQSRPERPGKGAYACGCGAAGAPCPICNPCVGLSLRFPRVMNEKLDERAKAQPKLENQCAAMHTSGNLCNTTPHPLFIERVDRRADYIHRSRT